MHPFVISLAKTHNINNNNNSTKAYRNITSSLGSVTREGEDGIDDLAGILVFIEVDRLEQIMLGAAQFLTSLQKLCNVLHLYEWHLGGLHLHEPGDQDIHQSSCKMNHVS